MTRSRYLTLSVAGLWLLVLLCVGNVQAGDKPEKTGKKATLALTGQDASKPKDIKDIEEYTELHYWPQDRFFGDAIPFYWQGEYHIFFQSTHSPLGMSWAHIVSRDLINWKELPDALIPENDPKAPDHNGCWTGSIIEKNGTFYCFYTGFALQDPASVQKIVLATSKDLIHWKKNPQFVIFADGVNYYNTSINGPWPKSLPPNGPQGFRDSEIFWNPELKKYSMLLHAFTAKDPHGVFGHYTSEDLNTWKSEPPLPGLVGGDCPYMIRHQDQWYLIQHMTYSHSKSVKGPFTRRTYDHGLFAVPKGLYDGKRYLIWAWVNTLRDPKNPLIDYTDEAPISGPGILSLPREVYFGKNGELKERFPKEVLNFFDKIELSKKNLKVAAGQALSFDVPKDYYLHAKVSLTDPRQSLKIRFRKNKDEADSGYVLNLDRVGKKAQVSGMHYCYGNDAWQPEAGRPVDVKLFVLGSVVECIIDDTFGITCRAYDYHGGGLSLETVSAAPVLVNQLQVKTRFKP